MLQGNEMVSSRKKKKNRKIKKKYKYYVKEKRNDVVGIIIKKLKN